MAIQTPSFEDIRQRYLQQVRNLFETAAVGPDSDHYVRASAVAAAVESLHQHVWWLSRQRFPDTADVEFMEREASLYGLTRKPAAVATGTVTISGVAGTAVSAGLQMQSAEGLLYELTANASVGGGGTVDVPLWALVAGTSGNVAPGTALTLTTPVPGITSATVVSLAGGAEAETDAELLARLLAVMRGAAAGGNAADYQRWALEVPGVSHAFVFGARRGPGTVDVAIMAPSGLPAPGLITQVTDYIDQVRPVTADLLVLQPDLVTVSVTATVVLSGVTLVSAQAAAEAAIAAYMSTLTPGDTVYRSRLIAAIQDLSGVVAVDLTAPAANVDTTVNALLLELATPGTVVLGV